MSAITRGEWEQSVRSWLFEDIPTAPKRPRGTSFTAVALAVPMFTDWKTGTGYRISVAALARFTGCSESTAKRQMKRLRDLGLVVRTRGHNRSMAAEYRLARVLVDKAQYKVR